MDRRHKGVDSQAVVDVHGYGQTAGAMETAGARFQDPRPSAMRMGLGKASKAWMHYSTNIENLIS